MSKRVLIISPYFPPTNAADMQRIRMSLPYFKEFGWDAEVVTVDPVYSLMQKDENLMKSIPSDMKIHYVKAYSHKITSKFGLGSIALRSLCFYRKKVDELLSQNKFDLIYFSTTQFPVCILGAHWKRKYNVPYIIDMQDPWHNDYYSKLPRSQRPPKYWFAHRLNKWMEPKAMENVDGLLAVSKAYIDTLEDRYSNVRSIPREVIPFGAFPMDNEIALDNAVSISSGLQTADKDHINIVYVGRGGADMQRAVGLVLGAFRKGLEDEPENFSMVRFHFFGTSYAPSGQGKKSFSQIVSGLGLMNFVVENTDRIPFYSTLKTLNEADGLFVPGSDDPAYTASKIYPYILAQKQLLCCFSLASSVNSVIRECSAGRILDLFAEPELAFDQLKGFISDIRNKVPVQTNWGAFQKYTARSMTEKQVELFNAVVQK